MKMIRAIIRPEREEEVMESLEAKGFPSVTKIDVLGRGKQKGIQVGGSVYDELAKTMILVVVEDNKAEEAVSAICAGARTSNQGDGKIFISAVDQTYTVRTGRQGL